MKICGMFLILMLLPITASAETSSTGKISLSVEVADEPGVREGNKGAEIKELSLDVKESAEEVNENYGITGFVIAEKDNIGIINFIPVVFIIFILAAKFYVVRKRKILHGSYG